VLQEHEGEGIEADTTNLLRQDLKP